MKCPKCGQEMIDNKDFCLNCGAKLKEEKPAMTKKTAIIVVLSLIVIGVITSLCIMYLGTGKELEPFLNK